MNSATSNDRATWLVGPSAQCSMVRETALPWRLILLGAPGVGKGTQAELLQQTLDACHLSTGDVFRAARKASACELSPAMAVALDAMQKGVLVPDSTVWEMVRERSRCICCRGGFILDGFPRTLSQASALRGLMDKQKLSLSAVVNYELPIAEIVKRLSGRRTCAQCNAIYHVAQQPPRSNGVCDHCGGHLYQRDDDRPDSVTVRMEAYQRSTAPLIEFYRDLGLLVTVPAIGSPAEICLQTVAALNGRAAAKAGSTGQYFPI